MAEKKYTKEALLKALEAVKRGVPKSSAAKQYNVPRTTLLDKLYGRTDIECSKGPCTVLTPLEEEHLENWIIFMADSGFPVTREQLRDSVCILIKKLGRKNPFVDNKPGRNWFRAFAKRHPKVGERVAQNLTQTRAQVTEKDIRTWFKEVAEYFVTAHLEEASRDPRRIFNCDESAFFLSPTSERVLAKRGSKNVYSVIPSGDKECVTVLITANGAGQLAPPMVLFRLKNIPSKISKQTPKDWGLGHTAKGWMTGESFYEYMTNVFYPWVEKNAIPLPIIFFLDGHCSHTSLPLSNFCREKNIILIALYPNATHLLQPMDVSVFRPLKRIWKKTVYEWRNNNQFVKLKKENFCPLLEISLNQLNPDTIVNGFRKTGLSPFNAESVDYSKCVIRQSIKKEQQAESAKKAHFRFFESQISPTKLKKIKENKAPTWQGSDKSLEGLFTVWRQMKSQISNTDDNTTDQEDDSSTELCEDDAPSISEDPVTHPNASALPEKTMFEFLKPQDYQQADNNIVTIEQSFGNFTGLSDILDPNNHSLDNISASNLQYNENNNEKIEFFEVINGELKKIMPYPEINKKETLVTSPISISTGQVIRTTGAQPIILTPFNKITNKDIVTPPNTIETPMVTSSSSYKIVKVGDSTTQTFEQKQSTPLKIEATLSPILPSNKSFDDNRQEEPKKNFGNLIIPTPFKDALFWPDSPPCKITKQKVKIPSVITSDRWQIFAQKKDAERIEKEKRKDEAKERKRLKTTKLCKGVQKRTPVTKKGPYTKEIKQESETSNETQKVIETIEKQDVSKKDWYCRLCQTCVKIDMIQCLRCKVWYHTSCAEVQPTEISFYCLYCNT